MKSEIYISGVFQIQTFSLLDLQDDILIKALAILTINLEKFVLLATN